MVEFFDYNCGYCKRAMIDMMELMKSDPKLKVVLKEFPVLGPGSVEAAQVGVAVRMQDASGKKYLDFHQKLLNGKRPGRQGAGDGGRQGRRPRHGQAREGPREPGSASATLEENFKLAEAMGMNGTPSYVIGKQSGDRRGRPRNPEGKNQRRALRQGDLLSLDQPVRIFPRRIGRRAV